MALTQEKIYTIDDIYALPDGQRAELTEKGCSGAPDWIIEITSPTNPQKETVMVYDLEREERSNQYSIAALLP